MSDHIEVTPYVDRGFKPIEVTPYVAFVPPAHLETVHLDVPFAPEPAPATPVVDVVTKPATGKKEH